MGGTLLSQADGKTSTNAQSKTHEVQFDVIKKSDSLQLARSINDSLVSYLMRLNYPQITPDRYPKFYFDTTDTEDLETFSKAIPSLVDVGVKIPTSWVHQKLGIPEPQDDQTAILQRTPTTPNLAANTYNPQLVNHLVAANSAQIPLEDQAMQLLLKQQADQSQTVSEKWLGNLIAKIQSQTNEDEVLQLLSDLYPNEDEPELQAKLTQLIFACEMLGRLSVEAET